MIGRQINDGGHDPLDVREVMHVDAPSCRFLAGMAELAPPSTPFVVRRQPRANVDLHAVSDIAGFDAQQHGQQHSKQDDERGARKHKVATEVLGVFNEGSGERPRCAIGGDEDGSAQDVAETLAFPLRHDLRRGAPRHGPWGEV